MVGWVLFLGIVFHCLYSLSIFDIYFRSPLVHGMTPVKNEMKAPAKRLVLIVGDGLRADRLFEPENDKSYRAHFLRNIVKENGAFGISHTRVPTESRPGHVSMIAGFYEDVSAVTKGWKHNPVNFDSFFNETVHTWSWGSPDILDMFKDGASDSNRIDAFTYSAEFEDFASDATLLDKWVFDEFEKFLDRVRGDEELQRMMQKEGIAFFFHLLGLDTNGHAHRPHSKEYIDNIRFVDKGVERLVKLINDYFNDDKTAFIFTADHGMSNRGSHGDGDPDNTRTPLIAWGAGIRGPIKDGKGHDAYSDGWGLSDIRRTDIEQADIAPFMSSLIGVPYPMNSVGVLPLSYFDNSDEFKSHAMFVNAKQILAQHKCKEEAKSKTEPFYKPFLPFSKGDDVDLLNRIQHHIDNADYEIAQKLSRQLIDASLAGLSYFQTYDWLFLRSIITCGFISWMLYSLVFALHEYVFVGEKNAASIAMIGVTRNYSFIDAITVAIFASFFGLLWTKQAPIQYYLYVAFPIFFFASLLKSVGDMRATLFQQKSNRSWANVLFICLSFFAALEFLVYSYFQREILCFGFLLIVVWILFRPRAWLINNTTSTLLFVASALITSTFLLLSVEMEENRLLLNLGAFVVFVIGLISLFAAMRISQTRQESDKYTAFYFLQLLFIVLCSLSVNYASTKLALKEGLSLANQISGWSLCFLPLFVVVLFRPADFRLRLSVLFLAFTPLIITLSISYEVLFYAFFSVTLFLWMCMEKSLFEFYEQHTPSLTFNGYRSLDLDHARIVIFFLFFINVAFFGTGNMASISSFYIESVYRLLTVFNPFLMGILLILKILIPFFAVSCILRLVAQSLKLPPFSLFFLVISTVDVMTLNFFYLVKDTGSWLEIGTTISHYVISSAFIVFMIFLFGLSHLLID